MPQERRNSGHCPKSPLCQYRPLPSFALIICISGLADKHFLLASGFARARLLSMKGCSSRLSVRDCSLRRRLTCARRSRAMAQVLDEALDYRAQGPILQRQDGDEPRPSWQIDWQHLKGEPLRIGARDRIRKRGDEMAGPEPVGPQVHGKGPQADPRHAQSPRAERLRDDRVAPAVRPRQDPWLVDELGEIDLATARPPALQSGGNDELITEQNFHVEVVEGAVVGERVPAQLLQSEIEVALAQLRREGREALMLHVEDDARIKWQNLSTVGGRIAAIASGHPTLTSPAAGSDRNSMSRTPCFNSSKAARPRASRARP